MYNPKVSLSNPYEEIQKLALQKPEHPYAKVLDVIVESVEFFKEVLQTPGYILAGSIYENKKVLTALGTQRITALVPPSMVIKESHKIKKIIAVGFKSYTDFFPQMFLDNLNSTSFSETEKYSLTIDLGIKENLRSNHLTLLLEREDVLAKVINEIQSRPMERGTKIKDQEQDNSMLIIFPAVLGRSSDHDRPHHQK